MAGFETRAIWGSDPGLISDRFRYTGVAVPPLDEEAIKRIQENTKQFKQAPIKAVGLPSPSEVIAIQDLNRLKAFEDAIKARQSLGRFNPKEETNWRHPLFSLNTNQIGIGINESNPFKPGLKAAEQEWFRRLDAGIPEGSAFDQMVDFRERAGEWYAIRDGAIPAGRIGGFKPQPRNPFSSIGLQPGDVSDPLTDIIEALLNKPKVIPGQKNNPNVFQQLLNEVGKELKGAGAGVKELGRITADVVLPNRNKVPDYMLDVVETPEFVEAKQQLKFFGSLPSESIAPGVLSEKQSRWLVDDRRTPIVGGGAFGAVTVPERSGKAFKVQEGQSKRFLENEIEMALRTAELGLGPQVHSATLQPTGKPLSHLGSSDPEGEAYRAIVRTEAVPHRKFKDLSPEEQQFLQLETFKLNEGLYRGGIENRDSHFENILLNDATKKAVQVDSGLARDYDAFNEEQLQNRLRNIVLGLETVGLKDVARDTSELGNALIDEAWKTKTPELYAEVENFFNRSGNILMSQSRPLAKPVNLRNVVKGATTAVGDITGSVPLFDPEFRQAVEKGDVRKAAVQVAKEYATGLVAAPVIGMGVGALSQVAPQAARVIASGLNVARAANPYAVVSQLGGSSPQPKAVGTYQGSTVFRNPQGALVAAPGGKPIRLGQAVKGGKTIFVPWGSVAGTKVGPRTVGRPWWDVGQFFGR